MEPMRSGEREKWKKKEAEKSFLRATNGFAPLPSTDEALAAPETALEQLH